MKPTQSPTNPHAAGKAAHTPGPWHRNIRREGRYPVVFAGRNQHVATASQQDDPAETEANIDLIAAAPELLALVRWSCAYGNGWNPTKAEREAHHAACLDAIARATGQGGGE